MKKTILALTVTSLFSGVAAAATISPEYATVNDVKEYFDKNGAEYESHMGGQMIEVTGKNGEQVTITNTGKGTYKVTTYDSFGRKVARSDVEVNGSGEITKIDGKNASTGNKIDSENKVIVDDTTPRPVPPIHIEDKEAEEIAEGISKEVDSRIAGKEQAANDWARQATIDFQNEVARLDSKIDTMEGRVSNGTAMVGAMSQMQFGRDGLGIGAGVSQFNGSKAVAVGVGYAFGTEKQWMAKGSFGYAESKKGKGSKDTMAAAGLTYSFK